MQKLIGMGVMNVTPDSFSDPAQLETVTALKQRLQQMQQCGIEWFDVGAQSTAPGRESCGPQIEWQRLQNFLQSYAQIPAGSLLSIDTYWPEVAWQFVEYFAHKRPDLKIVWNDVSGVVDQETHRFLQEFKQAGVVLGLTPQTANGQQRQEAQTHWQRETYFTPENIVAKAQTFFRSARRELIDYGTRFWFDPLFGFGKDANSNWALLNGLTDVFLPADQLVIGISRKRFLRQKIAANATLNEADLWRASDYFQVILLQQIWQQWQGKGSALAFRIHDYTLLPALKSSTTI